MPASLRTVHHLGFFERGEQLFCLGAVVAVLSEGGDDGALTGDVSLADSDVVFDLSKASL